MFNLKPHVVGMIMLDSCYGLFLIVNIFRNIPRVCFSLTPCPKNTLQKLIVVTNMYQQQRVDYEFYMYFN